MSFWDLWPTKKRYRVAALSTLGVATLSLGIFYGTQRMPTKDARVALRTSKENVVEVENKTSDLLNNYKIKQTTYNNALQSIDQETASIQNNRLVISNLEALLSNSHTLQENRVFSWSNVHDPNKTIFDWNGVSKKYASSTEKFPEPEPDPVPVQQKQTTVKTIDIADYSTESTTQNNTSTTPTTKPSTTPVRKTPIEEKIETTPDPVIETQPEEERIVPKTSIFLDDALHFFGGGTSGTLIARTYNINRDISIGANQYWKVPAGTILKFSKDAELTVLGKLIVEGEQGKPVVFTSQDHPSVLEKDKNWDGITFRGSKGNQIKYLEISRAEQDDGFGGAFTFVDDSQAVLERILAKNNKGTRGGVAYIDDSDVNFFYSTFQNNFGRYGGALYSLDSYMLIDGGTFSNNLAYVSGGAFYFENKILPPMREEVKGAYITLRNITLNNNEAKFDGGGFFAKQTAISLYYVNILSNTAGKYGGGCNLNAVHLMLFGPKKHINIDENIADMHGGISYSNIEDFDLETALKLTFSNQGQNVGER